LIHAGPQLRHDAGYFVTHRDRRDGLILAVGDVEVGTADARGDHLHHHLAWLRDRLRPLGEGDVPRAGSELGEADHSAPETRA
jgi:hypothetical protein